MNYYESLLELIKGKKEISGNGIISLSLGEIASAWNRKVIYEEELFGGGKFKYLDPDFLNDIASTIKIFENKMIIKFKSIRRDYKYFFVDEESSENFLSISDIPKLSSLKDIIFLETTVEFDKLFPEIQPREKILPKKNLNKPPSFMENPPQITWGNIKIPIPPSSIQSCICRVLFNKPIGETVSWDEIAEEIDGNSIRNSGKESNWRNVYDAVSAVNKKFKNKTAVKIFKTSRKSFSRIR